MKWLLKLLPNRFKIYLYEILYRDIADQGEYEDCELAHVNPYEVKILKQIGGRGRLNKATGLKGYFGGGGSPAPAPAPASGGTSTTITREAPEIEARKLALYDESINLAKQPVEVPAYQTAGPSPLEMQGFGMVTPGVGQEYLTQGISALGRAGDVARGMPNIDAFMNPYERYTIDEINRQAAMRENEISAQAVGSGAFGGGREGIQQAESERARLATIGQLRAQGFNQALGAAQAQQQFQTQAEMQQAQNLAGAATQAQAMAQRDIGSALQAGAIQRDIAQRGLTAERQTEVARAYEPFQRIEFQKGIMTALPTAASQVTAGTGPGVNPFAQAAGAGVGAYQAYDLLSKGKLT